MSGIALYRCLFVLFKIPLHDRLVENGLFALLLFTFVLWAFARMDKGIDLTQVRSLEGVGGATPPWASSRLVDHANVCQEMNCAQI